MKRGAGLVNDWRSDLSVKKIRPVNLTRKKAQEARILEVLVRANLQFIEVYLSRLRTPNLTLGYILRKSIEDEKKRYNEAKILEPREEKRIAKRVLVVDRGEKQRLRNA
jgi:hypothetical protein